jgi:hypothetical protein
MFYMEIWYSIEQVQYQMKPFSCQHREQHISKQNYVVPKVHTVGYSDYDVFLENDEGSRVYRCKKLF